MNSCEKKIIINSFSSSFCSAKWFQVTIDLVNGTNHSCHHPLRHFVSKEEIEANPSALHNTVFKKEQRKLMLSGERPSECSYCWKVEDSVGEEFSDRYIKTFDDWSIDRLDEIRTLGYEGDVVPSYLEIMLDHHCHLSCSYCFADVSSSVEKEMKRFGPYPVTLGKTQRLGQFSLQAPRDENYKKAFWKWFPEICKDLRYFRITGGEPLISQETYKALNLIGEYGHEDLVLAINSNLSVPLAVLEKYANKILELREKGKIGKLEIYASIDTWGEQASYIRNGLNLNYFENNLKFLIEKFPNDLLVIMATYNILSVPSFHVLLSKVVEFKRIHSRFNLDISYIKDPEYLQPQIADSFLIEKSCEDLRWMINSMMFSDYEILRFERIVKMMKDPMDSSYINQARSDFYKFINEFDRRYDLSFGRCFPELSQFFSICKKAELFERMTTLSNNISD